MPFHTDCTQHKAVRHRPPHTNTHTNTHTHTHTHRARGPDGCSSTTGKVRHAFPHRLHTAQGCEAPPSTHTHTHTHTHAHTYTHTHTSKQSISHPNHAGANRCGSMSSLGRSAVEAPEPHRLSSSFTNASSGNRYRHFSPRGERELPPGALMKS